MAFNVGSIPVLGGLAQGINNATGGAISQAGYNMGLGGFGISEPSSVAYNSSITPGSYYQTAPDYQVGSATTQKYYSAPQPVNYSSPTIQQASPPGGNGNVPGLSTSPQGNNGSNPAPTNNSNQPNLATQQAQAAGQVSAAQIQAAQDMYNNLRAQIEAQKGQVQNAYNTGLSDLNTQIAQAQAQGQQQKSDLNNQTNNAINTAYTNYRDLLGQQNRLAGAFGGGLSSYFLGERTKAGTDYGNTIGGMQSDLMSRTQGIDQNLLAMNQQAEAQKKSLADELQNGILKISLDENANDFQKADAIQKIQADYATQLASINAQQQTMQNQIAQAMATAAVYKSMVNGASNGFNPLQAAQLAGPMLNSGQLGTTGPGMIQGMGLSGSAAPTDLSKIYGLGIYGSDLNGNPTITGQ